MRGTIESIHRLFRSGTITSLGEGALLDRFLVERDPAAFEAILTRHGPMVLGVCKRFLRNQADVEDAFQATFLILVRKAAGLRDRQALAPWLYGVAFRVASRARSQVERRAPATAMDAVDSRSEAIGANLERDEALTALHEELSRLPETYRVPIVLCHLEGLTHEEAAERLNWPVGTVRGRLFRGRAKLRERLSRRGVGPVDDWGSMRAGASSVPLPLISTLTSAAIRVVTGETLRAIGPPSVAALARGVTSMMFWSQMKLPVTFLSVAVFGLGVALTRSPGETSQNDGGPTQKKQERAKNAVKRPVNSVPEDPHNLPEGTFPKIAFIEDTTEAISKAQRRYDEERERLGRDAARSRSEVEGLAVTIEVIKQSMMKNANKLMDLRDSLRGTNQDESTLKRLEHSIILCEQNSETLNKELRVMLEKLAAATSQAVDLERRFEELKRRPRPVERVEVQPGDWVRVEVLIALPGRPLSGDRYVGANGKVSLEFYGDLYVAGLSTDEIKEKVILRLRKFLADETLGLVVVDPDTSKLTVIPPKESDHVFVEIVPDAEAFAKRIPSEDRRFYLPGPSNVKRP